MKTLLILRHAKSSWQNSTLADHDRPLNERGKRDAPRMGRLLRKQGLKPDAVLCSTAKRARKTASEVIEASGYEVDVEVDGDLYHAGPVTYVETLQGLPDGRECVMVVGHNPGLQDLLRLLTDQMEPVPTAALAQVELLIDHWQDLTTETRGVLKNLWRPKELDE